MDNIEVDLREKFIKTHQVEIKKRLTTNKNFNRINEYSTYILSKEHPIKNDTILYDSFLGKSMTDNPYAIFLEILKRDVDHKYHHVWILENPDNVQSKRFSELDNVEFIRPYTKKHLQYLATAKYLIINTSMPYYFTKRSNQVMINTWHGTPLKGMGKYMGGRFGQWANVQRQFLMTDYMVYPNKYTQTVMNDSYDLNDIYDGVQLTVGYPRVDLIQNTNEENFSSFLNGIVPFDYGKKIVLYAPTWRGNQESVANMTEEFVENSLSIQNALPEGYQLLVKAHQIAYDKAKTDNRIKSILVPNDIDTSELLSITDVLISDYSSIFFDYLITGKPVFLYAYDLEEYIADRGLLLDIHSVPGNVVQNIDQLQDNLNNLENYKMNNSLDIVKYIEWQTGSAATLIVDELFNSSNELTHNFETKISNGRPNILLYLDGFGDSDYFSKVQFINNMNKNNDCNIILLTKDHLNENELLQLSKIKISYNHIFKLGQVNYTVDNYTSYSLANQGDVSCLASEDVQKIFIEEIHRVIPLDKIDHFIYLGKTMDIFEVNLFAFGLKANKKTFVKTILSYSNQATLLGVSKSKYIDDYILHHYNEVLDLTRTNNNQFMIGKNNYMVLDFNHQSMNAIKVVEGNKLLVIADDFSEFDELFGIYNLQRFIKRNKNKTIYIYGDREKLKNYFMLDTNVYLINSTTIELVNIIPLISCCTSVMADKQKLEKVHMGIYKYIINSKKNLIDINV